MTTDVTAVLNADFVQVFEKARAMKGTFSPTSKTREHPLETGATVTDHRIILPVTASLSLILSADDYKETYQQIRDLFIKGELLTVQTRVASFESMLIEKMPHDESADMLDGVIVALSLKEAQFVTPQFALIKVAKPKNSKTVPRGQQQPAEAPPARKSSILGSFFK